MLEILEKQKSNFIHACSDFLPNIKLFNPVFKWPLGRRLLKTLWEREKILVPVSTLFQQCFLTYKANK